jgi:hypothetical protein
MAVSQVPKQKTPERDLIVKCLADARLVFTFPQIYQENRIKRPQWRIGRK